MTTERTRRARGRAADPLPEPSDSEALAIAAARRRAEGKPPPVEVRYRHGETIDMVSPHADIDGHRDQLRDVFGGRSDATIHAALRFLTRVSDDPRVEAGTDDVPINAALAIMDAIAPRDELEAALATQMAGCHVLTLDMMCRARESRSFNAVQAYGNVAAKLQRTFALQMETLAKLRGGGKQQIEVRHVHVNGNAVIGNVNAPGGGGDVENGDQPQAQRLSHSPGAPCPPMWGEDAGRDALPVAGCVMPEAVSDARGDVARGRQRRG